MDEEESLDVGESIAITENADRMVGLTVNNDPVEQAWGLFLRQLVNHVMKNL